MTELQNKIKHHLDHAQPGQGTQSPLQIAVALGEKTPDVEDALEELLQAQQVAPIHSPHDGKVFQSTHRVS